MSIPLASGLRVTLVASAQPGLFMQLLKGPSFPRRACPREGVGRESTLQAGYLTWIPVFTGIVHDADAPPQTMKMRGYFQGNDSR